ncbi:MAG TPA: tetratricopeptide repeat protein, partial [Polyangia bacterium]
PHPLYALGRTRALGGDLGGAVRALDAAIVVAPGFLAAQVARAEVLLDLGQTDSARAALDAVLGQSPEDLGAEMLLAEVEAAAPAPGAVARETPVCTGERWRPPAIKAACELARAARARRAGARAAARAAAERAAQAVPDQPRLLARTALLLAELGAVDQAAGLLPRARRRAAATPALAWAVVAVALGRGREGALPPGPRPADPETALLAARAALAAGGGGALDALLEELGSAARGRDADLQRLARFATRRAAPAPGAADDPMQAYLDGLAAQLAGDEVEAAERFGHALAGHGDACRAAGEYTAALRAQKRRPERAVFAPLRAENSGCLNLR